MIDDECDARITSLEAAVADLRRELAAARQPRMRSMRTTGRCPSCGGGRLLHFRRVQEVGHAALHDMSLQKDHSKWWGLRGSSGQLEAYACRACLLVEWNATSLDEVRPDGDEVVELVADERDVNEGPYR